MKTIRLRPHLGILFILAVGIPSVALVVIAARSIGSEEALLEKRLERTLGAELDHVVSLVTTEMSEVQAELGTSAPVRVDRDLDASIAAWKRSTALVAIPFALSEDGRLVEPALDPDMSADELSFLRWNEEFLAGRIETPVFLNVAVAYLQEILGESGGEALADSAAPAAGEPPAGSVVSAEGVVQAPSEIGQPAGNLAAVPVTPSATASAPETAGPAEARALAVSRESAPASPAPASASPASAPASPAPALAGQQPIVAAEQPALAAEQQASADAKGAVQQALELFRKDEEVQRRVLEKARSEGATPVERVVQPQVAATQDQASEAKGARAAEQPSILVSSQRTFEEIQAGAAAGLVPRFVDDGLELLFWRRTIDGGTVGCLVNLALLQTRLASLLPDPFSGERILAILDEHAEPLGRPPDGRELEWRRPFVAAELPETLPRWEAASYLADPDLFASQVRMRVSLLWIMVAILFASIAGGGTFVFLGLGAELRAAQQRTTFVANVSHELKTPLTSIRMFAEMLREGRQSDPDRRQRYLDLMVAESERLARLVNNVLDFSQLEQGRKRYARGAVDLVSLCRGVVETVRPRLEAAGFSVGFTAVGEQAVVTADADAIRQVLANLLSNAEKYSAATRSVEVEAGCRGDGAFFRVLDRGIGVPAEHAQRIFREFYRVDDSLTSPVKGTGLGLSIARRIVADHGGRLSYAPRDGGGSAFEACFPAGGPA